ncbi:basal cell adhesion molecule-like, partial [Protobothrops mucrosquamatus]|uniref:basal cell adhesion molecule-like n=1 Tax=Protobothrops mucrosquamatus TaxID=103944 RepID=UPI000775D9F6
MTGEKRYCSHGPSESGIKEAEGSRTGETAGKKQHLGARCQAKVQVSMVAEMEVVMGQQVPIFCSYTGMGEQDYLLVEWFTLDKNGEQRRVAYNEKGKVGVDRGTEYTDRVFMDANNSLVITAIDVNDEKFFSCQVTSGSGSDTGRTQLKVFEPCEAPVKHSANKYVAELLVELDPTLIQSGVQCTAENKYGAAKKSLQLKL